MARSKSSNDWMKEHFDDHYVKQAQIDGYRSRAVYKLLELQDKDKLFKSGMSVLDLGAAPGSWSQIAARLVGDYGRVVASDILPMDNLAGVTFVEGDFREESVLNEILAAVGGEKIDLVICDMAPNISGNKGVDQPRAMYLADLALDAAYQVLKPGGDFVVKVFQGEGFDEYRKSMIGSFSKVLSRKPDASRARSKELYLVGRGYKV